MWINQEGERFSGGHEEMPVADTYCTWVEEHEEPVEPFRKNSDGGDDWVPNWLAQQFLHLDADEAALKSQHNVRMASISARRRYLKWAYLDRAETIVKGDLEAQGGKRKSVDYDYGRCGWRSSKKVVVVDADAALAWADEHCPEAIKCEATLLKGSLPKGVDVPGVERVEESNFYVKPGAPK